MTIGQFIDQVIEATESTPLELRDILFDVANSIDLHFIEKGKLRSNPYALHCRQTVPICDVESADFDIGRYIVYRVARDVRRTGVTQLCPPEKLLEMSSAEKNISAAKHLT